MNRAEDERRYEEEKKQREEVEGNQREIEETPEKQFSLHPLQVKSYDHDHDYDYWP